MAESNFARDALGELEDAVGKHVHEAELRSLRKTLEDALAEAKGTYVMAQEAAYTDYAHRLMRKLNELDRKWREPTEPSVGRERVSKNGADG